MDFKLLKWACSFPTLSDQDSELALESGAHYLTGKPELKNISPMVKRRMPMVAKAMALLDDELNGHQLPAVYASRNAELSRTFKLIRQFKGDLSPAMFSMSVNNAIPGLLSVTHKNTQPYAVIDSMSGLLPMAFLEASNLLLDHDVVKIVVFEEQATEEFKQQFGMDTPCFAVSFVISKGLELSLELLPRMQKQNMDERDEEFGAFCMPFFDKKVRQMDQVFKRQVWRWRWH